MEGCAEVVLETLDGGKNWFANPFLKSAKQERTSPAQVTEYVQALPVPPDEAEKLLYVKPNGTALAVPSLCLLIAFAWGAILFMQNHPLLWLYAPFVVIVVVGMAWNVLGFFLVRKFDYAKHCRNRILFQTEQKFYPSVDVYLPNCGEDIKLLAHVFRFVRAMAIAYPGVCTVWVLDDKGRSEVKAAAKANGFRYSHRENAGWLKKSGNMRAAFKKTDGEFIAVFDADFAPRADYLNELVWLFSDPKLGIIQTPHYFRVTPEQPPIEKGGSYLQESFFRVTQQFRDIFGAAICCGSNAIYRREALAHNGGSARVDRSEDVNTGLDCIRYGYKLKYVPLNLAGGLSPDSIIALHNQHYRWCSGAIQTRLNWRLWHRKVPLRIKLIYSSSLVFFLVAGIGVVMFGLPSLVNLWLFPEVVEVENYVAIMPAILLVFVAKSFWANVGWGGPVVTTATACAYTYLIAVHDYFRGSMAEWVATGERGSKGQRFEQFKRVLWLVPTSGLTASAIAILINWERLPPFGWAPALLMWVLRLMLSLKVLHEIKKEENATN